MKKPGVKVPAGWRQKAMDLCCKMITSEEMPKDFSSEEAAAAERGERTSMKEGKAGSCAWPQIRARAEEAGVVS